MITDQGQLQLLKLVSGKAYKFADLFAVGVSDVILPSSATQMDFAWATCPIVDSYVDAANSQVVFHGALPENLAGDVKEIGLISQSEEFISTGLPNSIVFGFEPIEQWYSDITYEITNLSTIGANNYKLVDVEAGNFLSKVVSNINVSRYDTVKLKVNSVAVTSIRLMLKNDEERHAYKDFTLIAGANTVSANISSFTKVGAFDPKEIFEIRLEVNTTSNSTNSVEYDALSLFSTLNGGLVARDILATTQFKRQGSTMELECAVAL